ncbi:MAG: hypothetical protein U0841_28390 [Chloroflexia bacterium]
MALEAIGGAVIEVTARERDPLVVLRSEALEVSVTPGKGGDITGIRHRPTGQEVLFRTPWGGRPGGHMLPGSDEVEAWLNVYGGGWQLMLPNAGTACTHQGVRHVFHGEAALAPWEWSVEGEALTLRLSFFTLPLVMTRRLSLDGDLLRIDETLVNEGPIPVELVWGHHPGFGGDPLAGPARLACGGGGGGRCRGRARERAGAGRRLRLAAGARSRWADARPARPAVRAARHGLFAGFRRGVGRADADRWQHRDRAS